MGGDLSRAGPTLPPSRHRSGVGAVAQVQFRLDASYSNPKDTCITRRSSGSSQEYYRQSMRSNGTSRSLSSLRCTVARETLFDPTRRSHTYSTRPQPPSRTLRGEEGVETESGHQGVGVEERVTREGGVPGVALLLLERQLVQPLDALRDRVSPCHRQEGTGESEPDVARWRYRSLLPREPHPRHQVLPLGRREVQRRLQPVEAVLQTPRSSAAPHSSPEHPWDRGAEAWVDT